MRSKRKRLLTTPSVAEYFGRSTKRKNEEFLSRTVEEATQGDQSVKEDQAKETLVGDMSKEAKMRVVSKKHNTLVGRTKEENNPVVQRDDRPTIEEDINAGIQGDQPALEGQDLMTQKSVVSDKSGGIRLVSEHRSRYDKIS